MPQIVAHIEAARKSGLDVAADTYGYPAAFNTFSAVIPPWAHDGGDKKLIDSCALFPADGDRGVEPNGDVPVSQTVSNPQP